MPNLIVKSPTLKSNEVAAMVEKEHPKLLRDIRTYLDYLAEANIGLGEYFHESTYLDKNNQARPCFEVTKKGCELIAHKLTGEKGTIFSARYIDKFHEMESNQQFKVPSSFAEALRLAAEQSELIETQNQIIGELKPKADYVDKILKSNALLTITQIAKDYGMTGNALNSMLYELKIQYKQSDQWLLYKGYSGLGYTSSQTIDIVRSSGMQDVKLNTKWTQKGRMFLYELLKNNSILPEIEKL